MAMREAGGHKNQRNLKNVKNIGVIAGHIYKPFRLGTINSNLILENKNVHKNMCLHITS